MRSYVVPTGALVLVSLLAFAQLAPAQSDVRTALPLGATRVELSHAQVTNAYDIRAFVATDSLSTSCLLTFAESNYAVPGMTAFCAPRIHDNRQGVLISVFYPTPPPDDLVLHVTLYQEHAKGYAPPVLYIGD
jgi:hypothetical protein